MRVGHCIHGLGMGGAQKVIAAIVRGRSADVEHAVYSSNDGVLRAEIEGAGAAVRILDRHLPKLDPLWALRLGAQMRRDRVDLVHTHLFGDSLHGYLGARVAGGRPVVMTLHSQLDMFTPIQQRGYRWLLPRCARIVACSAAVAASFTEPLAALGPDVAARLTVIPNGIAAPPVRALTAAERRERRARLGVDPEAPLIAAVGRLAEEKRYDLLIAAFAQLVKAGDPAWLVLIGDGPLRAELEERAAAEGVAGRAVFAGYRDDVPDLLPAVDVVAFSSRVEGLSITLLEAMAAGRAVVATELPGILEAVRPDREALIVPVGDVDRLAAALRRAAADGELRAVLGRAAKERFRERFTAATMVGAYEAIYRQAGDRGAGA